MRVTNTMISNSAQSHIGKAKNKLYKYQEQYTSQQKIQRPSDDPVVAVRALKLRTTYSQLTQYADKNVKDALNWMDTTESALSNVGDILTTMKGYLVQGNCDDLEVDNRTAIIETLKKNVEAIFQGEANSDYSGRYLFTGYRTDTSLLFPEETRNFEYKITENFAYDAFRNITSVVGGAIYGEKPPIANSGQDYVEKAATTTTAYRLQLAYDNCADQVSFKEDIGTPPVPTTIPSIEFTFTDKIGNDITRTIIAGGVTTALSTTDPTDPNDPLFASIPAVTPPRKGIRDVRDDEIFYLRDTGEVIIGKDVYSKIQANQAAISIDYLKTYFDKSDIRPEMYFEATRYDTVEEVKIKYDEPDKQEISYEINYSQTMAVNVQARDAISTDIYRSVDYIQQTIQYVEEVETKIKECQKLINNTKDKAEVAKLESLKKTLEDERKLRVSVMAEAFGMGLTIVNEVEDKLNVALADIGARYKRTELTSDKLLDTRLDTEEKLSNNEGVDLPDVFIGLTQADNLYQASLSATSKILGNSLLNYI